MVKNGCLGSEVRVSFYRLELGLLVDEVKEPSAAVPSLWSQRFSRTGSVMNRVFGRRTRLSVQL